MISYFWKVKIAPSLILHLKSYWPVYLSRFLQRLVLDLYGPCSNLDLYFVKINLMMKIDRITDRNLLKLKQFNESKVCYSYIINITFIL